MIILGIDPGIATMGYGVVDKPVRLAILEEGVNKIIDRFAPEEVALEELFFTKNITTGIAVAQARGVTLLACVKKCGRLYEYTPMQIKQALTGYGRADKQQIQQVVTSLLRLKSVPRPDDAADALAIALCHAFTSRFGALFSVENSTRTKDKNAVTGSYFKSAMELEKGRKRRGQD